MTGCPHPTGRRADVTDFDTAQGQRVEMCRDCGDTIVSGPPPTRHSLMSPVEVVERTDDGVVVRAHNGDTWAIPAVLFDALYRPPPKATG